MLKKKCYFSGNQWSCFPGNGVRQLASDNEMEWILEHKKSVADSVNILKLYLLGVA